MALGVDIVVVKTKNVISKKPRSTCYWLLKPAANVAGRGGGRETAVPLEVPLLAGRVDPGIERRREAALRVEVLEYCQLRAGFLRRADPARERHVRVVQPIHLASRRAVNVV